jgi:predicted permease
MTPGMFAMLGRAPLHGRVLGEGDEQAVVLSHDFWMRRFGGSRDAIGESLAIAGTPHPYTIVGVMPADFVFPYRSMLGPSGFTRAASADMWRLLTPASEPRMRDASGQANRTLHMLSVVARLKPEITIERARAELMAIADARAAELPETNRGFGVTVRPLLTQTVGAVRPALLLLLGGVGLLLLMTCLNVANVLLARLTGRHRDTAVRAALGASRGRLAQQSLVESLVLAAGGGALGALLVVAGRGALLALAPSTLPRLGESTGFVPLLVSTVTLAMAAGLFVGLVPALVSSRTNADEAVRITRGATTSPARRRLRAGLVIAQLALATTLTVAGGVLLRSFVHVLAVDPGFTAEGVLTFQISAPRHLQGAGLVAFYDQLQERLEALPGVQRAGGSTRIPLGSTQVTTQLNVEGRSVVPAERPEVEMRRAVGDYFQAMNIPVLQGRVFTPADRTASIGLAVINAALAERVFRGEAALGRRVQMGPNPNAAWLTVIGVVGNIKHTTLEEMPRPEIYISHYQGPPVSPFMAVRTSGDPAALTPAIRRTLTELGADPPFNVRTMDELRTESMGERRFVLVLVGLFGVLALALAGVGIYGVVALVVSERTAELGVRLALGATPGGLLNLVVGQAMRLAVTGAALGVVGAAAVTQAMVAQLYGVSPVDPLTFASVALVLVAIAAAAALVPARRAMRLDPADALRT